ncbi:interferon-induced very large GTPase 1-like protein [Labeo rohita]|uniref:Interferon-induced very large GTPase 1-like protein n=1 Tax=Labeo rohita TaxID=84645 RepID=A0A498M6B6_LABRO|nr:interferon-induced very large GTPase 1-like protein [Labeo rohita]
MFAKKHYIECSVVTEDGRGACKIYRMMKRQTSGVREDDEMTTEERDEDRTEYQHVNHRYHRRKKSKSPPPYMSDLRIVVLGWSVSENSHVGNFILGRAAFDSEAPPDVVERVTGRLKDRHVIIINSPQLLRTNISDHQITQTVRECVHLSDPGPHVIVLLLKHEPCSAEDQERVEKVLLCFSERVYQHTMVLSTRELTETNDILQKIIQKCANRHFSLQMSSSPHDLLQMFEDIEKMNDGRHLDCAEDSQYFTVEKQAKQKQGVKLNLVVCGSDATLKSSISEQIQQRTDRRSDVDLHGRLINLVELPALIRLSEEEVMRQTLRCVSLCHPGVHVFIIVIPDAPLNNEDKAEMEDIQRIFSSRINKHIMILIKQNSERQTAELSEETQSVIQSFGGRHHFFGPKTQVSTLMENIEQMLEENREYFFSTETLLEAQMEKLLKYEEMKKKSHLIETHLLTQGLFDTELTNEEIQREIRHCISMILPGPHVFLLLIPLGRYTQEGEKQMEREKQEQQMKILMDRVREREEEMKKLEEENERMKMMMKEEQQHQDKEKKKREEEFNEREEQYKREMKEHEEQMRNEMKKEREIFKDEMRQEKKTVKKEKENLHIEIDRLMNRIENERQNHEMERNRREEEFNEREKRYQTLMKEKEESEEELIKKHEEEKERMKMMMEEERHNQDKERKRREEKLTREITEQEKHQREIHDEMRRERETFRHEIEQMRQEKEKLKIKCETEIDRLMNRIENERKKREEEYIEREKRYKSIIKEKEREISEMKREREELEKQNLEERMIREEDKKRREREEQIGDEQIQIMKSEMEGIIREKERIQRDRREQIENLEKRLKEERKMREDQQKTLEEKLKLLEEQHNDELKIRQMEWREEYEREKDEMKKKICSETNQIRKKQVHVIDCPDLLDPDLNEEQLEEMEEQLVSRCSAGLSAVLLTVPLEKPLQNEEEILEYMKCLFGPEVQKYIMILFTHGDELDVLDQTIHEYLKNDLIFLL